MPFQSFNPRTREGATWQYMLGEETYDRFNPRTREGATAIPFIETEHFPVSIHAPVRVRRYSDR